MSDTDNFDKNDPFSGIAPEGSGNIEEKKENSNLIKNEDYPNDIKTIGDKLKSLRLSHSLSIEQLADTTRIRSEFLVALEKNDFSKLPGLVFAKGFIKNLARFYKIKDEELISLFQSSFGDKSSGKTDDNVFVNKILSKRVENSTEFPPDDITHKNGNILNSSSKDESFFYKLKKLLFLPKYILISLALVLIVFLGIYFITYSSYSDMDTLSSSEPVYDSNAEIVDNSEDTTNGNDVLDSQLPPSNESIATTTPTTPTDTTSTTTSSITNTTTTTTTTTDNSFSSSNSNYLEESVVKLSIKAPTTIRTKKDSSSWEEKDYTQGEYNFDFKKVFHIFIKDSSLVRLSINDVDLGDLSNKGIERRLTFYHNKELPQNN